MQRSPMQANKCMYAIILVIMLIVVIRDQQLFKSLL